MSCGNIGDDDEDPKWWTDMGKEPVDDPNSIMGQVSNALGDFIDNLSNLITASLIFLGGFPVMLMMRWYRTDAFIDRFYD